MSDSRLHYFDGIKGISALIVALYHTGIVVWGLGFTSNRPEFITKPFIRDCFNGNFAVWIFVLLSSMLVCHGLDNKKYDILLLSEYYKRTELWNLIRAAALVSFIYCFPFIQIILSTKALVWLGKLSLNIYLLQLLVLYVFTCRIANCLDLSNGISQFFIISTTLTIIIILSWLWSLFVNPIVDKVTKYTLSKI